MGISRKHYVEIAAIIRDASIEIESHDIDRNEVAEILCSYFTPFLLADNLSFDVDKFREACLKNGNT